MSSAKLWEVAAGKRQRCRLLPRRSIAVLGWPGCLLRCTGCCSIYVAHGLIRINAGSFGGKMINCLVRINPTSEWIEPPPRKPGLEGAMSSLAVKGNGIQSKLLWAAVIALGALSFGIVALNRGESVNAAWLVIAAVCIYFIAYRFYALFISEKVLGVDPGRQTPAYQHNDGLDYVPTNRYVLFGHHFAAIAGAGPLVGPVLAAQMGYLPGTLWILVGVVFAGAVQDLTVLFLSTRRDGRSLGDMVKMEMGPIAGGVALVGTLGIMIIILAALGLVVVKALGESPWGTFTVAVTIPTAMLMGVYMRSIRPGKVGEASAFGVIVLLLAIWYGQYVAQDATLGPAFTYSAPALALAIIVYGAIASMLPVWLLLAPRDYLSTFLKIGVIVALAIGIYLVQPDLKMEAGTRFTDGSGPVFSGPLFPFLFITIACGAVSGFHALISSGTTPKMIERESDARFVGYGGMLMESFVAIMALSAVKCARSWHLLRHEQSGGGNRRHASKGSRG